MEKKKYSPMMEHYLSLKEQNPDSLLFYRLGDFYELFMDDAKIVSKELNLVLTAKAAGNNEKVPMCGVPFHAASTYIERLVKAGYRIAVCEQLEDPAQAKGLVERGIIRIITPGTYMEEGLEPTANNYMAALHTTSWGYGLLFCDLSTGQLVFTQLEKNPIQLQKALRDYGVKEVVYSNLDSKTEALLSEAFLLSKSKPGKLEEGDKRLLTSDSPLAEGALKLLMQYLSETQMQHIRHLMPMEIDSEIRRLEMDPDTKNHLELTKSFSSAACSQSLFSLLNETETAMGARRLRSWIENPLVDEAEIRRRQEAVMYFKKHFAYREAMRSDLNAMYDLERLTSRIVFGSAGPRDILQLTQTLANVEPVLSRSAKLESFPEFAGTPACQELYLQIKDALIDEPPLSIRDGGFIRPGYSEELDRLAALASAGKDYLLELEARERERTGIKALKIGYNRILGYYIEVRKGSLDNVKPEHSYEQIQTLTNAVRFKTKELKSREQEILQAQADRSRLEKELFEQILKTIQENMFDLHALARTLSDMDVLQSLGTIAAEKGWVLPQFNTEARVNVVEGRHPVLDARAGKFVSNSWQMEPAEHIQLITGPNMGGKSTYMRQNALLVILAQMGSCLPARSANLPIFDAIFTRIGASDDLLSGKSTFMVEMLEANAALSKATPQSLILFDEIGRGTATYDGMALAQAMLEYIDEAVGAKTLFSTHYHELTELEERGSIRNVHADVREQKGEIEFRYRIEAGKADKSYGINVARLAGLPSIVLERADDLLHQYESQEKDETFQQSLFVMDRPDKQKNRLAEMVAELDVDSMSPREALDCLYALKKIQKEE